MKTGVPAPRAPHPNWRFPPGSVVAGQTKGGRLITISAEMRARHVHMIGATGMGKTVCIDSMVWQDITEPDGVRRGVMVFDPHGAEVHALHRRAVSYGIHRVRPVHLLDPCSDPVFGLNLFRDRPGVDPAVVAAAAADAVAAVWDGEDLHAKPLLTQTLKMIFWSLQWLGATLLEADELADISDDNPLRAYVMDCAPNHAVRRFWRTIEALTPAKRDEKLSAAVRRLGEFLLPQSTRRIFAARDRAIDFRAAMDNGECLLIDLSYGHGRISKDEVRLLGAFMLNDIFLSCLGRPAGSTPVFIYIDEVQLFLTDTVAAMLDQARKFGVHLILSHQHLGHLRERGETMYRSVMTNTRTKIVFGGLDDDDATLMAKNLYRGTYDLEMEKARYNKPVVVSQVPDWMLSKSDGHGIAVAHGNNWSQGGGTATNKSTTRSRTTTESEATTISESDTTTESSSSTEGDTYSQATTTSESHGQSSGQTNSRGGSASYGAARSSSAAQGYDVSGNPVGGTTQTTGRASDGGSASSWGTASTEGSSDAYSRDSTEGSAHSTSTTTGTSEAHTSGIAQTTGFSVAEGIAETEGTTESKNWSRGGSTTNTMSRQRTEGRSQTLRSVFAVMPTQSYSLDEQVHLRSVELAHLNVGEAVVAIGRQPPYRIRTLRFRQGWARPEHVEAVKRRIAAMTPFMTPVAGIAALYYEWRKELATTVRQALAGVGRQAIGTSKPPPIKDGDEGWG